MPHALKQKIEVELNNLVEKGITQPVKHATWAAPVLPILKPGSSLRLCGDYKVTINKCAITESYPLPGIEELFSSLAGGKSFSKLDLSHAYLQIELDDASKEYVTQRIIQIQQTAIWGVLSTRNFPTSNGEPLTRVFKSLCVY